MVAERAFSTKTGSAFSSRYLVSEGDALTVLPALFGCFPRLPLVEDQPFDHVPSFVIHGFREIQIVLG
ncbi:hypothetical protein AB0P17_17270 [Streptomyces sp. NPDC088124]|uniref:hypothetical protein n=1 Tax=Streptomyces sp. NPDC088124 TaxID=3154654 RepID=UPI00342AED32